MRNQARTLVMVRDRPDAPPRVMWIVDFLEWCSDGGRPHVAVDEDGRYWMRNGSWELTEESRGCIEGLQEFEVALEKAVREGRVPRVPSSGLPPLPDGVAALGAN